METTTKLHQLLYWRPSRHIAYWLCLVLFFGFFWGSDEGYYLHFLASELILLLPKMAVVYITLYWLMPKLLWQRKYVLFMGSMLITLISASILLRILAYYFLIPLFAHGSADDSLFNIYRIMQFVADLNTVLVLPIGYSLMREWQRKQLEASELKKQQLEAELQFLKNQTQPHFLFNSLNNLYALVLKKSDNAPDVLLQLSALLRYQLYEAKVERIELHKEIQSLQHYIGLERLRLSNQFQLNFVIEGNTQAYLIAPLLLIPFVENAFKHSANTAGIPSRLDIHLAVHQGELLFEIQNTKNPAPQSTLASGIGLTNTRRRLELLYPNQHLLQIDDHDDTFNVQLQITLAPKS